MINMTNDERETSPFLLFWVRQHLCAVPLTYVVETMRPLPVETIASAPAVVKGLAIIRGMSVPVVDLGYLLDEKGEEATRFVTVRTGENQVALAVKSVMGLRHLSAAALSEIPPLLSEAGEGVVASVAALDADLLMVLDTAQLIPASLWETIKAAGDNE